MESVCTIKRRDRIPFDQGHPPGRASPQLVPSVLELLREIYGMIARSQGRHDWYDQYESNDNLDAHLRPNLRKMTKQARKYLISGRVQGVGYRYFAVRVAHELGLQGWVRNLSDGCVEAYAIGRRQELDEFDGRLRLGPPASEVRSVAVEDAPVDGRIEGFDIR